MCLKYMIVIKGVNRNTDLCENFSPARETALQVLSLERRLQAIME